MFLFRVDGNSDVGIGHIIRCLSIAGALLEEREESIFVTASADFMNEIKRHGHRNEILDTNYADMLSERNKIKELLNLYQPEAVIVDSYFVSYDYLNFLHELCHEIKSKLIYIDDILSFAYPCDILVNYNIYGPEKEVDYSGLYRTANMDLPVFLLGPQFTPLRAEFRNIPNRKLKRKVRNILITTGGSDAEHMGLKIVETIKEYEESRKVEAITYHFVVGAMNEDKEKIEEASKDVSSIILHYNVSNMSELMQSCDVAISAAGSTLYELCATQTPGNTYILSDNQVLSAEGFENHGVLKNCGDIRENRPEELAKKLLEETARLAQNYNERVQIAKMMGKIVDGFGAKRIAKAAKNIKI